VRRPRLRAASASVGVGVALRQQLLPFLIRRRQVEASDDLQRYLALETDKVVDASGGRVGRFEHAGVHIDDVRFDLQDAVLLDDAAGEHLLDAELRRCFDLAQTFACDEKVEELFRVDLDLRQTAELGVETVAQCFAAPVLLLAAGGFEQHDTQSYLRCSRLAQVRFPLRFDARSGGRWRFAGRRLRRELRNEDERDSQGCKRSADQ
jgi:hypothetical protein